MACRLPRVIPFGNEDGANKNANLMPDLTEHHRRRCGQRRSWVRCSAMPPRTLHERPGAPRPPALSVFDPIAKPLGRSTIGCMEIISGSVISFVASLWDIAAKSFDSRRARRAEDRADDIEARRCAPFLVPSTRWFQMIRVGGTSSVIECDSDADKQTLCWKTQSVAEDSPDGSSVCFVLENRGPDLLSLRIFAEASELEIGEGCADGYQFHWFWYPYSRSKRGESQVVKVIFESSSGHTGTQLYRTEHGFHTFVRIHPKAFNRSQIG